MCVHLVLNLNPFLKPKDKNTSTMNKDFLNKFPIIIEPLQLRSFEKSIPRRKQIKIFLNLKGL